MSTLYSYPKVYALGHAAIADLFLDPVTVEEKVDGSQFSFGMVDGELCCRSKSAQLIVDAPEKMFAAAVATARELAPLLVPGWIYRCEYLAKPKHGTIAYDRVPARHLVLFDVNTGHEAYMMPAAREAEARRLGLEAVPVVAHGIIAGFADVQQHMDRVSMLGGAKVEGLVFKNYKRFGVDGHALMGKYVSEKFKEVHKGEWRAANPIGRDILAQLILTHKTPARWAKAVQHLRERGELLGAPQDIGPLMRELRVDIEAECADEIKAVLYGWAQGHILRGVAAGFPEWYKEQLAEAQFTPPPAVPEPAPSAPPEPPLASLATEG